MLSQAASPGQSSASEVCSVEGDVHVAEEVAAWIQCHSVIMDLCTLKETAKFHVSVSNSNRYSWSVLVSPNEPKYSSLQFHSFWTLSLFLMCLTGCQATSTVVLHIQQH